MPVSAQGSLTPRTGAGDTPGWQDPGTADPLRIISPVKTTLYVSGAVIEFVGIMLVSSTDVIPVAGSFASWSGRELRSAKSAILRCVRSVKEAISRRPSAEPRPRPAYIEGSAAASSSATAEITTGLGLGTADEKLERLLPQFRETQREVRYLAARLDEVQRAGNAAREALRAEFEDKTEARIATAAAEARATRFLGAVLLVIGLGLSTAWNLVH